MKLKIIAIGFFGFAFAGCASTSTHSDPAARGTASATSVYESEWRYEQASGFATVIISGPTGVSHMPVGIDANSCQSIAKQKYGDKLIASHIRSNSCIQDQYVGYSCDSYCEALVKNN